MVIMWFNYQNRRVNMKTFMKRITALVLVAAMAVMAFAGCQKSSGSKSAGSNKSADTMFGLVKEAQSLEKRHMKQA